MDRSAFDGTLQKVFLVCKTVNERHKRFAFATSQVKLTNCLQNIPQRVWILQVFFYSSGSYSCASVSSWPMLRQPRTYIQLRLPLGQWWSMQFINIKAATCSTVSLERKSVIIKFTALKPLSHSEVLHGLVLIASTRGFSFCVICLSPVSL